MDSDALAREIAEFLHGERRGVKPIELCRLIIQASQHNDQWTKAPLAHWELAIETAIKSDLIEQRGELLWLKPIIEKPKAKQLGLFE